MWKSGPKSYISESHYHLQFTEFLQQNVHNIDYEGSVTETWRCPKMSRCVLYKIRFIPIKLWYGRLRSTIIPLDRTLPSTYLIIKYSRSHAEAAKWQWWHVAPDVLIGIIELDRVEDELLVNAMLHNVFNACDGVQPPLRCNQTEAYAWPIHRGQLCPGSVAGIIAVERWTTAPRSMAVTAGNKHEIAENGNGCKLEHGIQETRVGFLGQHCLELRDAILDLSGVI